MRASLIISGFAHVAVLAWASVSFPAAKVFEVTPMVTLPVDIVSASELTRLTVGKKDAPKAETPTPPAPEEPKEQAKRVEEPPQQVAAREPEPKPEPEAPKTAVSAPQPPRAEPEPEAEPVPKPKAETKPEPEPKQEEPKQEARAAPGTPLPAIRPAYTPPPKPKTPERKFEPDRIAALLNKLPDKSQPDTGERQPDKEASLGDPSGRDSVMSLSEIDALRQQIARCWSPPVGVQGAADLAVKVGLELNRDGTLVGEPEIISDGSGLGFQVAADAARRAVLRCQPYSLPPEKYDAWRRVNVNFDPRLMLGG